MAFTGSDSEQDLLQGLLSLGLGTFSDVTTNTAQVVSNRNRVECKALGIYYTPPWLALPITRWALNGSFGSVLDPSFGGCAFLNAALDLMHDGGVPDGGHYVFGCDVDRQAKPFADDLIRRGVPRTNLRYADFISPTTLAWLGNGFRAVVGNPPYVRHHALSDETIERAQELSARCGSRLPRTSGAWAYFTVLSASCVARDGRLALVLPGAILHTGYGSAVLEALQQRFDRIRLLHSRERIFLDARAEEETVVVLASGSGRSTGTLRYQAVEDRRMLLLAVCSEDSDQELEHRAQYKLASLPTSITRAFEATRRFAPVANLNHVAIVRIGVVTSANDFFIRPPDDPIFKSKNVRAVPIVRSARQLKSPVLENRAVEASVWQHFLAVIRARGRRGTHLWEEISRAEKLRLHRRHHALLRRPVWYQIKDLLPPDAFLPYMVATVSGLTLNQSEATCTNALHRIYLREPDTARAVIASSHSALFAFEAELYGRHYGGGVLKIEPSAAQRLAVATQPARLPSFRRLTMATYDDLRAAADAWLEYHTTRRAVDSLRRGVRMLKRMRQGRDAAQ